MNRKGGPARRLVSAAMIANSAFWFVFWTYFVSVSSPAPSNLDEQDIGVIYHLHPHYVAVFGRQILDGGSPVLDAAAWVQLPSILLLFWLGYVVSGNIVVLGTNFVGLKLLAATPLSYLQWYAVALVLSYLRGRWVHAVPPSNDAAT